MIWVLLAVVALVVLAPILWAARGGAEARGRKQSAMALHRAQLAELDRDLAEGRIVGSEHVTAKLEVQRRLLATAEADEAGAVRGSVAPVLVALVLAPVVALGLYVTGGVPGMPSVTYAERVSANEAQERQVTTLIAQLRQRLASLDPKSDAARQGYVLLGNVEAGRGNWDAAATAWRVALATRFDATTAAQAGEAMSRVAGRMTPEAEALFRRALQDAPPDAPWRAMVEQRLAEAKGK